MDDSALIILAPSGCRPATSSALPSVRELLGRLLLLTPGVADDGLAAQEGAVERGDGGDGLLISGVGHGPGARKFAGEDLDPLALAGLVHVLHQLLPRHGGIEAADPDLRGRGEVPQRLA